ncbi:MAG TPA: hypothetical protein DCE56_24890 [Cyanobacteria bacterium UBA8553]|nr:hypothetical protein [Cyanobacteria bacterium UBA8553]
MRSDFLQPFEREFDLDERLSEDYVESLVMQGYSYDEIVNQAEALRSGTPLDELPLDMDTEDYYDYLSRDYDLTQDNQNDPEPPEYIHFDPNAPGDF